MRNTHPSLRSGTALTLIASAFAMLLMFTALSNTGVTAQTGDTPTPVPTTAPDDNFVIQDLPPFEGKINPPRYPNMDSNLNRIVDQFQTGQFSAQAAAANAPIHREESVAVTLYVTEGYAQNVWDWLEESDASPRNIGIDYIEAYVPVSLLPQASKQEGVISVRTIIPSETVQGLKVSEGVAVHGVPAWHDAGFSGQGIKIGIIDSGFEGFRSLTGTELPASVQARCYTDIGVFTSNLSDCDNPKFDSDHHGTASTELIFDVAQEATYYVSNGRMSHGDLQNTVNWMVAQEVDVINTSLDFGWVGDPGDGTSPWSDSPLHSVDIAVAGGIVWATSAGNGGASTGSWFGGFSDRDSDGWLEFSGADETNRFHSKAGDFLSFGVRWEDDYALPTRDLDICLLADRGEIIVCSEQRQPPHTPLEGVYYEVPQDGNYSLAVRLIRGSAPIWVDLWTAGLDLEHNNGGYYTIANPAISRNPGLLAVGAAAWWDPHAIAPYSSRGPTNDGRTKPDIIGATEVTSSVYEHGFGGTSASSPYVAGLAALVKQRFPHYSPQRIAQYLKENAEPRPADDPILGPSAYPNNTWGYGFARLPPPDGSPPIPIPRLLSDRDTLVALYNSTDGPNWINNKNWLTDAPIGQWYGISARGRQVRQLVLNGNQLVGTLPPELGNLEILQYLDLHDNQLNGEIPPEIGKLSNLENLYLSNNQLAGQIPSELGNLTKLRHLWLARNSLSGAIPPELGNLSKLTWLSLSGNQLTGCIPKALRDVERNDLDRLGLDFCDDEQPPEPTHTPVPTATPVAPTVPTEVLSRLSALETLVATLQGLISTLEGSIAALNSNVSALASRVAALEADSSRPTPAPQPTPSSTPAPQPTPIPVPAPNPIPSPSPGAVPESPSNQRYAWEGSTTVVSWDAVSGAAYYNIYYDGFFSSSCRLSSSGRPVFCEELATNIQTTSYTHTSPDEDDNYYWIAACNGFGCSDIDSANPARLEGSAPAPDLVVGAPTVSDSILTPGERFTLSATVLNQGNFRSDSTTLRYYESSDSTITTSDIEHDTEFVSRLDPSESSAEDVRLIVDTSAAGTYYLGACVDAVANESDMTNNCSSSVQITAGSVPGAPANQRYTWSGSTIVVSWDAVSGADYYNIYYDDFFDSNCRLSSLGRPSFCEELATNIQTTSYIHASPDEDDNYYWIVACNGFGCSQIDRRNPAVQAGTSSNADLTADVPSFDDGPSSHSRGNGNSR